MCEKSIGRASRRINFWTSVIMSATGTYLPCFDVSANTAVAFEAVSLQFVGEHVELRASEDDAATR